MKGRPLYGWYALLLASLLLLAAAVVYYLAERERNVVYRDVVNEEMKALINSVHGTLDEGTTGRAEQAEPDGEAAGRETGVAQGGEESAQRTEEGKINLNTATVQQLDSLPGIGETKAKAIVEYRTVQGPFRNKDELMKVKGIGPKTFERLKDLVTVSDEEP